MVKLSFVDLAGTARIVDAPSGLSVADAALMNSVKGIEADCGGHCACATCHVYLEDGWFERVPPAEELERHMLDFTIDPRPNSRLACQIRITDELAGLEVHLPARQY